MKSHMDRMWMPTSTRERTMLYGDRFLENEWLQYIDAERSIVLNINCAAKTSITVNLT